MKFVSLLCLIALIVMSFFCVGCSGPVQAGIEKQELRQQQAYNAAKKTFDSMRHQSKVLRSAGKQSVEKEKETAIDETFLADADETEVAEEKPKQTQSTKQPQTKDVETLVARWQEMDWQIWMITAKGCSDCEIWLNNNQQTLIAAGWDVGKHELAQFRIIDVKLAEKYLPDSLRNPESNTIWAPRFVMMRHGKFSKASPAGLGARFSMDDLRELMGLPRVNSRRQNVTRMTATRVTTQGQFAGCGCGCANCSCNGSRQQTTYSYSQPLFYGSGCASGNCR